MKIITRILVGAAGLALCAQALAQVTFYEGEGFRGRAFTVSRGAVNLQRAGFNDRASSVIVDRGRWEVCEDAGFGGRCVLLRPGNYGSLRQMGLDNRVSLGAPGHGPGTLRPLHLTGAGGDRGL
ncbi:MAG: beta/gamma crystallin family protein [Pseudomonadota bacterium]